MQKTLNFFFRRIEGSCVEQSDIQTTDIEAPKPPKRSIKIKRNVPANTITNFVGFRPRITIDESNSNEASPMTTSTNIVECVSNRKRRKYPCDSIYNDEENKTEPIILPSLRQGLRLRNKVSQSKCQFYDVDNRSFQSDSENVRDFVYQTGRKDIKSICHCILKRELDSTHSLDSSVWKITAKRLKDSDIYKIGYADTTDFKVYSGNFSYDSLHTITAGSDGKIAIYDVPPTVRDMYVVSMEHDIPSKPVISWQAHRRWVSCVKMINDSRIIASADDGSLSVWNLPDVFEQHQSGVMKDEFFPMQRCHTLHDNGIFHFDYCTDINYIVTGSKDKTVKISSAESNFSVVNDYIHDAPLKSVCFRDRSFVASTGNDKTVRFCDIRSKGISGGFRTSHDYCVHSVQFSTHNNIVTASADLSIQLYDIRRMSSNIDFDSCALPILILNNHNSNKEPRRNKILYPFIINCGNQLITPSENRCDLTVYCLRSGDVLRKITCDSVASLTIMNKSEDRLAVVMPKTLQFYMWGR